MSKISFSSLIKEIFEQLAQKGSFFKTFLFFWLLIILTDGLNYTFQTHFFIGEENSRYVEIGYQLIIVFYTVIFYHALNRSSHNEQQGVMNLLLESLYLTPGFILQTLFFVLALGIGLALLVLPFFYVFLHFYFAPTLSVLYPDYKGKLFFLARDLVSPYRWTTFWVILFTGILPFIPDGIVFLITGNVKGFLTLAVSPLSSAFYLFSQAIVFLFVYKLVDGHRKLNAQ